MLFSRELWALAPIYHRLQLAALPEWVTHKLLGHEVGGPQLCYLIRLWAMCQD